MYDFNSSNASIAYTREDNLSPREIGRRFDQIPENIRNYVDTMTRYSNAKIATIKFLRSELGLSLTQSKALYEARHDWLNRAQNPYGWV